jgi:hypothetical protein
MCSCAAPLRPLIGYNLSNLPLREKTLPFTKSTKKTSDMTTKLNETGISQDPLTTDEWIAAISRQVDLEGLVTEGYGYSVSITGPPRRRRDKFKFSSFTKSQLSENTSTGQEFPMRTTDISIEESYEAMSFGLPNFWERLEEQNSFCQENTEFITQFEGPESSLNIEFQTNQEQPTSSPDEHTITQREMP